ncbi:phage gene 29 protein family protein [Nocardia sp. NPDC003963]
MGKIWRLEDIDSENPEERFLPVLQFIPIGWGGDSNSRQRIVWPEAIARAISKHLTEAGCPPIDPALATKKLRPPYRGEQHPLNGMGGWVPLDEEDPEPVVIQDPMTMTKRERQAVVERLRYGGYRINEPPPEQPVAKVVDTIDGPPRFDPGAHTVTETNAYLRELGDTDEVEKRRVLYTERHGQARNGILKRWS